MSIGEQFVIICPDVIVSKKEKEQVLSKLKASGREIIKIKISQMRNFCGNCLQVRNKLNQLVLCL